MLVRRLPVALHCPRLKFGNYTVTQMLVNRPDLRHKWTSQHIGFIDATIEAGEFYSLMILRMKRCQNALIVGAVNLSFLPFIHNDILLGAGIALWLLEYSRVYFQRRVDLIKEVHDTLAGQL